LVLGGGWKKTFVGGFPETGRRKKTLAGEQGVAGQEKKGGKVQNKKKED